MSAETALIEVMDHILPKDRRNGAGCFEADAQVFDLGDDHFVFSTDGFSREDLFLEENPGLLGWNVAVGAISDILAAGGAPLFYGHAMTIGPNWDEEFVRGFSHGVARALELAGVTFLGGDLGRSGEWKYAASVIGRLDGKPVLRSGASPGDLIYLSGSVGAGNLQAALNLYAGQTGYFHLARRLAAGFRLRLPEARVMKKYATSAIDTSDGVFDALGVLSDCSGTGYVVEHLPYIRRGVALARLLGVHRSLLFFGGCGEYELLFTVSEERETAFLAEAKEKGLRFHRLGRTTGGRPPARVLVQDGMRVDVSRLRISARDYGTPGQYLQELRKMVEGLVCRNGSSSRA